MKVSVEIKQKGRNMDQVIDGIRKKLSELADEEVRKKGEHFFKENVKLYGIRNAEVHKLSKELFRELDDKSKKRVYGYCEELWKSGYIEESFIACNWSLAVRKESEDSDIVIFEKWINSYVNNWASCDTLCNHTVGELIEKYPELINNLKKWAHSGNRWMRRAAAVSLIVPARKGKFLDDIFAIANILLEDEDDMVRKGYGWMLKAASEASQEEVYDFVVKHHGKMPRTAFRYAIEKLPAGMRARAMSL